MIRKAGKLNIAASIVLALVLSSCAPSTTPVENAVATQPKEENSCKDFPVVIYPNTTSATCEKNPQRGEIPLSFTAFVESADSVEQVTKFYQTEVQASGWTVDPNGVQSSTHSVVSLKKGKGYASVIVNTGANDKGSSFQIHAYPNGNSLE